MPETTKYEIDPGYGFQEEMAAQTDHIQTGTFRIIVAILVVLVAVVQLTVEWAKVSGHEAQMANGAWDGPPVVRLARIEAVRLLSQYEVVDEDTGTYRIPIERAMALEVEEGGEEGVKEEVKEELKEGVGRVE